MTDKIVGMAISFFIGVILFGAAMTSFTAQSTAGWATSVQSVWTLLPVLGILGVALLIFNFARKND